MDWFLAFCNIRSLTTSTQVHHPQYLDPTTGCQTNKLLTQHTINH
uniref:Uncharacterized protein n=1 Tax=Arundo donax TaxID=35708 RepID=A0A0A8YNH2_ARUDO